MKSGRSVGRLVGWLIDWLIDWLTDWLIDWLIGVLHRIGSMYLTKIICVNWIHVLLWSFELHLYIHGYLNDMTKYNITYNIIFKSSNIHVWICVYLRDNYVDTQHIYGNMRENYVIMRFELCCMSALLCCMLIYINPKVIELCSRLTKDVYAARGRNVKQFHFNNHRSCVIIRGQRVIYTKN